MHAKPQLSFRLDLVDLSVSGYWFCLSGQHVTERIEREQGLPAVCKLCGSTRIRWNPPLFDPRETQEATA